MVPQIAVNWRHTFHNRPPRTQGRTNNYSTMDGRMNGAFGLAHKARVIGKRERVQWANDTSSAVGSGRGGGGGECGGGGVDGGSDGGGGGSGTGGGRGISWDDPLLPESSIFTFVEEA